MTTAEEHVRIHEKLKADRYNWDSHWQDIADTMCPNRQFTSVITAGQKRNKRIYDTTALLAGTQLASVLHSTFSNPASRWFSLTVEKAEGITREEQLWLDLATQIVWRDFQKESGMFANADLESNYDLVFFGNSAIYSQRRESDGLMQFRSYPLDEFHVTFNAFGEPESYYRGMKLTAKQAASMFGDKLSDKIKQDVDKDPLKTHYFIHVCEPDREDGGFLSTYIDRDEKSIVRQGKYDSAPYTFSRWSLRSGENYGFGPGGAAYPDASMLNGMMETLLRASQKNADPTFLTPADGIIGPVVMNPAGIVTYDSNYSRDDFGYLEPRGRLDVPGQLLDATRQVVRGHFYVPWLGLMERPQMTATEVLEHRDQSFRQLAPIGSRARAEKYSPLIKRVFLLRMRYGEIPPPPASLARRKLKIEYISQTEQMQRQTEVDSIMRTMQLVGSLAQFYPQMLENFNPDEIARMVGREVNRVPERIMVAPEAVRAGREQRAQQEAAIMQAQMAQANAGAFKDVAAGVKGVAGVQ